MINTYCVSPLSIQPVAYFVNMDNKCFFILHNEGRCALHFCILRWGNTFFPPRYGKISELPNSLLHHFQP